MNLKTVFSQSKGVLSHGERDYYLAWCAFANEDGSCWQQASAIAETVGVTPQSGARFYKKLVEKGFLTKVKGGHICVTGFEQSSHHVNKSSHSVNFSSSHEVNNYHPDGNKSSHHVNSDSINVVNTKKEKKKRTVKVDSETDEMKAFRKTLADYQQAYLPNTTKGQGIAQNNAIRQMHKLTNGNAELCLKAHEWAQREFDWKTSIRWPLIVSEFSAFSKTTTAATTVEVQLTPDEQYGRWLMENQQNFFYGKELTPLPEGYAN